MPLFGKKDVKTHVCGAELKSFDFQGEPQLYCERCNVVHYNVSRPIGVYVGRVAKGLEKKTQTFRMILEYPSEKAGQQIIVKIVPYQYTVQLKNTKKVKMGYMKITVSAGDRIAVAGSMVGGVLEAYFSHNLTVKLEEYLMPMIDARIGILKKIRVIHPYSAVAKEEVQRSIQKFETEKEVNISLDYHAQARNFELLVSQLFEKMGFKNMSMIGGASDKGIDIEGFTIDENGNPRKIIIQCKHQNLTNPVKPSQLRDFAHTIERENAQRGYFVTSSLFSPECFFKENCGDKMTLIDRNELIGLLKRYGLSLDTVERT